LHGISNLPFREFAQPALDVIHSIEGSQSF